jgi:hypothetical protein
MAVINKGEVLLTGEPLSAIRSAQGKIWKKLIDKGELAEHQKTYPVILSRLFSGKTIIHAYADNRPGPGFEASEPDLEDVYFACIAGHIRSDVAALKNVG